MTTPAQASGYPDFVTDWPVQGPTDKGIRSADCWFAQNRLPAKPACVDCDGPVPPWARTRGLLGEGQMETISYGGKGALGFALGAAGDPGVFSTLTAAQQQWVQASLVLFNTKITQATGTTCPTWVDPGVNLSAAVGCFQIWWNANLASPHGPGKVMRTDGTLDADTLAALQTVASLHPADFNVAFPGGVPATTEKKGLSTGAMVGIGVAGATVVGGIAYAATRKSGGRGRRRR